MVLASKYDGGLLRWGYRTKLRLQWATYIVTHTVRLSYAVLPVRSSFHPADLHGLPHPAGQRRSHRLSLPGALLPRWVSWAHDIWKHPCGLRLELCTTSRNVVTSATLGPHKGL